MNDVLSTCDKQCARVNSSAGPPDDTPLRIGGTHCHYPHMDPGTHAGCEAVRTNCVTYCFPLTLFYVILVILHVLLPQTVPNTAEISCSVLRRAICDGKLSSTQHTWATHAVRQLRVKTSSRRSLPPTPPLKIHV